MGVLGRTYGLDECVEIPAVQMRMGIERGYAGGVPSARYERASPERGLCQGIHGNVGQDLAEDFGGQEDLVGGFVLGCLDRGNRPGRRSIIISGLLNLRTYWYLEKLGHLYVPVALGVEGHGGKVGI